MTKLKMPKGTNASAPGQAFIAIMVTGDEAAAVLTKGIADLKAKLSPVEFVGGACEALRDYFERNVDVWNAKTGDADAIKVGKRKAENRLQYWRNAFGRAAGGKFMRQKDEAGEYTSTFAFEAAAAEGPKVERAPRQTKGAGAVTLAQFETLRAAAPDIALAFARMVLAEAAAGTAAETIKEDDAATIARAAVEQAEAEVKAAEARATEARAKAAAHAKALADANAATKGKGKGK